MNATARVIVNLSLRDYVKPALKQLHWLPIEHRITYKLCLLMHVIHISQAVQYLTDCISKVSTAGGRYMLRLTDSAEYVLPRTRTKLRQLGFCYSGSAARNSLPSDLHECLSVTTVRRSWALHIATPYKSHIELELEYIYFDRCH